MESMRVKEKLVQHAQKQEPDNENSAGQATCIAPMLRLLHNQRNSRR
jgi:hypothetical protein